jgi:hypothetical protein
MENGREDLPVYGIEVTPLKKRGILGRVETAIESKFLKDLRESRGREKITIVYASSAYTHLLSNKEFEEVFRTPALVTRKNGSLYIFVNYSYYEKKEVQKNRALHYDVVIAHEVAHTLLDEIKDDQAHQFSDCSSQDLKEEKQADFIAGIIFYHISYHRRKKAYGSKKLAEQAVLAEAMKAHEEALHYVKVTPKKIALRVQAFKQGWDSVPKSY